MAVSLGQNPLPVVYPLLSLPQKPVQYDVACFGGDDTQLKLPGILGTIVLWDVNFKNDTFKTSFVFIMKIALALLDGVGIGSRIYGDGGFGGKMHDYKCRVIEHPGFCTTFLARNLETEKLSKRLVAKKLVKQSLSSISSQRILNRL